MNIQRMKFAWARGARFVWPGYTEPFSDAPVNYDDVIWHEDKHLQYGPLSTALRADALERHMWNDYHAALTYVWPEAPDHAVHPEHWLMLKLFTAEYLADMGL